MYYIYEVASQSYSILTPKQQSVSNKKSLVEIQKVIWGQPSIQENINNNSSISASITRENYVQNVRKTPFELEGTITDFTNNLYKYRQPLAFVFKNDIYYKYDVQDDIVTRITKNGIVKKPNFLRVKINVLQFFLKSITLPK